MKSDRPDVVETALQAAVRYLGYRSRSEAEVRRYLQQRGFSTTSIEASISRLVSLNYLNDEVFARNWALSRAHAQSYGPLKIDQELRQKGVAPLLVSKITRETFDQLDEATQASRLLTKRFKGERLNEPLVARRAAAFLQRRGYSDSVIFALLGGSSEADQT